MKRPRSSASTAPLPSARRTASTRAARSASLGPDFLSPLSVVIASDATVLRSSLLGQVEGVEPDRLGLLVAAHRGQCPGVRARHLRAQAARVLRHQGQRLRRQLGGSSVGLDDG